ncbi:TRAP transporter small permease [Anaerobacillus sp. MEB173]|uniref:TRAP transporter small permease n=1 Tax=Anaerobacillus sp. MEB173 TaxID=3383345 RepID=UPI003F8FA068
MDKIDRIEKSTQMLDRILEYIAVFCLILSVVLSIFSITMRNFFNLSYGIVEELTRFFIIYGVFSYIGPLIKKNEHIKMDLIQKIIKARWKNIINLIISIILFCSFAFLLWNSIQWVYSLLQMRLKTSTGTMLMFVPTLAIPIGMLFGCVYSFIEIIKDTYKIKLINKEH